MGGRRDGSDQVVAEAELRAEVDGGRLAGDDHLGAHVERAPRERDRAHAPTEALRAFEQRDLDAGRRHACRRRETGDPAASDHDAHCRQIPLGRRAATTPASVAANAWSAFGAAVRANGSPSVRASAAASTSRS
jgi:hypothetical protein